MNSEGNLESDCCNISMNEGEYVCPLCKQDCNPIETEEEAQERLHGQESDYQHIKENLGLTDH